MTSRICSITTILLLFAFGSFSQAQVIEYGDFDGDTVSFIDVTESSLLGIPLYDSPDVIGDTLDFPGTGFVSQSENGGIEFLDGRLTLMIEADPGTSFNSVTLEEFGAYFTFGEESISAVSAIAFAESEDGIFSGEFAFVADGSNGPNSGGWLESLTIFFPATDKITLTIDNQLFTFADDPGVSFIDKKGINISVGIPEPTTAALLAMGGMALIIRRRR